MMTGRADFTGIVPKIRHFGNWTAQAAVRNTILVRHSAIKPAKMFRIWSTAYQMADAMRVMPNAGGIASKRRSSAQAEAKMESLVPIMMIARRLSAVLWMVFAVPRIYGNAKEKI